MFQHCQPMRNHDTEQLQEGNRKITSEKVSGQLSSIQLVHPLYTSMIISSVSTFTLHSYIVPSFFIGFTSIQTFSYHIASQDFVLIWGFVDAVSLIAEDDRTFHNAHMFTRYTFPLIFPLCYRTDNWCNISTILQTRDQSL